MLNVLAWIEINRARLMSGFVAVIVVFGVVYLWRHFAGEREAAANTALLELRAKPGQPDTAPKASDFLAIAEQHASTAAAPRARLLAAGAFFADNKYSEAQTEFEEVLAAAGSGPIAAQAAFGIAACLDSLDKTDEALTRYQEVISRFAGESVAGQARLAIARIQEVRKQPAAALRLYDELVRDKDAGPFSQQATLQREQLLRQHPELAAGTNAPATK